MDRGPFFLRIKCCNPASSEKPILEFSVALGKLCVALFRRLFIPVNAHSSGFFLDSRVLLI